MLSVSMPNKRFKKKIEAPGVPVMAQGKQIQLGTMRLRVRSLALLHGLRIWRCHELWCRSQMWLGSGIAVALVHMPAATTPIRPLAWEPLYVAGAALKSKKKKIRSPFFRCPEQFKYILNTHHQMVNCVSDHSFLFP